MGSRTLDRATAPRRETATSPPALSSQRNVFTQSRVRGRCADNSAMQRELKELRRESYITLWVIRSTMKTVTLSLGSLSLSSGHATCDV